MALTAYIANDNVVRLEGLTDSDDVVRNDATVTGTLEDSDGNAVTGFDGQSMPNVSGSDGDYQATLQDTVSLTAGTYTLKITANISGLVGYWEIPVTVQTRTS